MGVFDDVRIACEEHTMSVGLDWRQFKVLDAVNLLLSSGIVGIKTRGTATLLQQQTKFISMQRADFKF